MNKLSDRTQEFYKIKLKPFYQLNQAALWDLWLTVVSGCPAALKASLSIASVTDTYLSHAITVNTNRVRAP